MGYIDELLVGVDDYQRLHKWVESPRLKNGNVETSNGEYRP